VDFPPAGVCDGGSDPPIVINICGNGVGSLGMVVLACCGFFGLTFLRRRM